LKADEPRLYVDYTGTGNTLNAAHPVVLHMIMDSLRYWVTEMHVDGFRFDLAATLAREEHAVDRYGTFFGVVQQDPVLKQVKLIAEPWDLGEGGYQVGNFPPGWTEWNGKYRDAIRSYWKGDGGQVGELARRLSGSSDIFAHNGRGPTASVNFVTAHDGFTLNDLVSYNEKHNEANWENNRDGESHNLSWNCGVEGPADEPEIRRLRERQKRNFLATLLFSQGVPMLLGGDEMGRTQRGNNNAYCQDNEVGWVDWDLGPEARELLEYTRRLIALRNAHPLFRRRTFFHGRAVRDPAVKDLTWLAPSGKEMTDEEWSQSFFRCLGVFLSGRELAERDEHGRRVEDDDLLLLLNAHHERIEFKLPSKPQSCGTRCSIRTPSTGFPHKGPSYPGPAYPLEGRSVVLLCFERAR
jgi:glycogen operon protein